MNSPLIIEAPAKLNLSLRVWGKRDDGFHAIDTLMVKLPGLCDHLELSRAGSFSFDCDTTGIPTGEENLVVKAAREFECAVSHPLQVQIFLKKRIPHGAGLAGGSSDAAATLLALNEWHGHPLPQEALARIAAGLGSDVPFFLSPGAARCTGRGEIIETVPPPPAWPVLLLKPSFGVSTPDAYRRWKDSCPLPDVRYVSQEVDGLNLVNDLEQPVFQKHRFLAELKEWLLRRPEVRAAMMSGSGSTVFAILHLSARAEQLAQAAREELDPTLWCWSGATEGA